MRTLQRTLAAVATATLVMFGTMGGALAQTKVTLHLDWLINGFYAPFFTALEKGWYKEAGLDVKIVPGKGSFDAVRSVGAGNAEFGFANSAVMVKAAADGLPVVAVAVLVQDSLGGIVSLGEPGIQKPKDLEGKTLGIVPEEAVARLLPAFFKINDVDPNKVKIVNYTFATKDPSLLAGKVDSVGGYIIGEYLNAKKGAGNRKVNWLAFSDFGLQMYSNGIFVNKDFLKENPKAVDAFVKASIRGMDWALKNVDASIDYVAKHTETDKATLKEQFEVAIPYMNNEDSKKLGLGAMTAEKWEQTQKIMVEYGGQVKMLPPDEVFTTKFLP
ncbi:MAG TPA: ABC transporter substrate-binding protein [Alphaproteobacteria bacterium]|jgi:NitT/TauT family transport system substrate-binding protein